MSMSAYSHYRVSQLDWVESLPSHWQEGRLRWLARRYAGGTPDRSRLDFWEDGNIPWLNSGSVNDSYIVTPSAHITEEALANSSARWAPKGALVMALAGQGKTKGMVAQLGIRSTCNQSMAAIVPDAEIEPRFLLWWLTANYQNIRNMAGGDLRDGLNLELLGNIGCPLPTVTEQAAIAAFLDRETSKIDALVEAQARLIDLLKEKRQAVTSHAVTKGLDPDARMKDSGVEWLGQVPAHWVVTRLANLFREVNEPGDESLPVLSVSIHNGVSDDEADPAHSDRKITRSEDRTKYKRVEPNDLVYNMMRAWQGGFGTVQVVGAVSPAYVVARPFRPEVAKFIELLLRTPKAVEEMRRRSRGITAFRLRLYWDEFKDMCVAASARAWTCPASS